MTNKEWMKNFSNKNILSIASITLNCDDMKDISAVSF
jgi:hypothetical protein